ncbi:U3 snoRNP-associated protein-like EMB2271 [Andrographis paniculata]|uniref:U3 snoRNP-associated protein-like EMB2271 n=1 Tax=Andrographis paniculata TaxID=175694 RepID=UPI0021E837BF|nr:U3 snoRNP-associated protein-like EMB2271 [Andrographis paniculata]
MNGKNLKNETSATRLKTGGDDDEDIESSDDGGEEFDTDEEIREKDKQRDGGINETADEKKAWLLFSWIKLGIMRVKPKKMMMNQGKRDSQIAEMLQQEQLEKSGRSCRAIGSSLALSEDDSRGFSASKDGNIIHLDVESGNTEKYTWPSAEVLKCHGLKDPQGRVTRHSKHLLALAVSSVSFDGRYLASGGLGCHVHL